LLKPSIKTRVLPLVLRTLMEPAPAIVAIQKHADDRVVLDKGRLSSGNAALR
jgi:hypothetical protein